MLVDNFCRGIEGPFSGWSKGTGYFCSESGLDFSSTATAFNSFQPGIILTNLSYFLGRTMSYLKKINNTPISPRFPKFLFHGLRDGLLLVIFLHSWAMHQDDPRRSYRILQALAFVYP